MGEYQARDGAGDQEACSGPAVMVQALVTRVDARCDGGRNDAMVSGINSMAVTLQRPPFCMWLAYSGGG